MPPKPPPGKKGADEVDMSDLASLPPLNFITFSMFYNNFFSQATREKLQKYVNEHFPPERVKVLTREEIMTYGKGKQFILEPGQAQTLPADDPRAKMSEADQIAKSAYERLFELQVIARRTKKERIQKLEDEAKAAGSQQPLQIDTDLLDQIFHIVDFPQSKEEAVAFAKLNTTINLVLEVNQVLRRPANEDEEDVLEAIQAQEQPIPADHDGNDHHNHERSQQRLDALLNARQASSKTSVLRHLAHLPAEYVNFPFHEFRINEHGEEVEVKKDAEQAFSDDINGKLEHYGALYIKYQRFREKVSLMPLAPDTEVLNRLVDLQGLSEDYKQWLSNVENLIASLDQQITSDPSQSEVANQHKREVEEERITRATEEEERKRIITECKERLKESVDDKYYISNFSIDAYKEAFLPHKEGQNSIGSIMNAMVSQISLENSYFDVYEKHAKEQHLEREKTNQSTLEDTLDDLFDSFNTEINYDLQITQRPDYPQEASAEEQEFMQALAPSMKERKKGAKPYLVNQNEQGDVIEYNCEADSAKRAIQKLQRVTAIPDETRAEDICARSKHAVENLVLPGISQRHLMPQVPLKSQRLRDMEKPALYPFATLPVDEVERGLVMKAFQELIRSNHIDEGAMNDKQRHAKYKVFERAYEEHMTPEILRQVLAEALIQEPDIATLYYPRDDSLLVALYNKMKSDRDSRGGPDGERQWRAAYRTMPDFENWIKYFSEEMVVEAQGFVKVDGHPVKYQLDEEMVPETLIDMDDLRVGNIQEVSEKFYPYDGSVVKVDHCSVGGLNFKKNIVTKDNLCFGLRRATDRPYEGSDRQLNVEEHGLVSYKKIGGTEFWLRFENDTKVLVESVQKKRNPQKLIRIDPPKPTPEEIAAREEAIKQAQAAAAKNKGKPGQPPPPVIEEYKEPEPTWEPEPIDFLDTLFNDEELEHNHYNQVTTTLPNGLIVQHLSDGNIIQLKQDQLLKAEGDERDRLYLFQSNGVVVRHLRNRDAEVLYPSGVRAVFTKKDMTWVITNNKGLRRAKKAGVTWDLDPIPCAYETDAVTNARMMIREDKAVTVEFADGSLFCQHPDGTLMRTSNDGSEVRIEKDGLAPIVFKRGVEENGVTFFPGRPQIESERICTPEQRSLDKMIVETHLPDGTIIDTYLDQALDDQQPGIQHLFRRPDFSVISINQQDKIKVISSNARSALNEANTKRGLGQDIDYLIAISGDQHDLAKGVYTAVLSPEHSELFISDEQANIRFTVTGDLRLAKVPIFGGEEEEIQLDVPIRDHQVGSQDVIENISGSKNPHTKHFLLPRLFVIRNDGSGYEMLSKEQLDYYFRTQKHNREILKQRKDVLVGSTHAKAHYFMARVRTLKDKEMENMHLKSLDFPDNSLYALLHLKEHPAPLPSSGEPLQTQPDQYVFRQILEFQPFEMIKQIAFNDDLERYKKWKMSQVRYETEFGIQHAPNKDGSIDTKKIEEEEVLSRKILLRILKERKNKREPFDAQVLQMDFLRGPVDENGTSSNQRLTSAGLISDEGGQGSPRGTIGQQDSLRKRQQTMQGAKSDQELYMEHITNLKDKQKQYIDNQLQGIRRMVNTPEFVPNYYQTKTGQKFVEANPPKAPSQEVLMRMSQRIDRSQQQQLTNGTADKPSHHMEGSSHRDQPSPLGHDADHDDKESPIVALEPEEPGLKQGSAFLQGGASKKDPQGPLPSLYLREKQYIRQKEQESLLKAEEYHVIKTKEFNVVGRLRQDKPQVKVMQKSTAQSELNEKFITTECIADRRVKISSMAPRQYINAPSVEDVRKQGQHQMILSAIDKKQTFAELINQANSMVTGVLHDPLKRSFNVMPSILKFGALKLGLTYELFITLKNEDSVALRLNLKPLTDPRIQAQQCEMGLVAPGMLRKVSVTIHASEEGSVKDVLSIVTKSDIFKVPIEATILSPEDYERELNEQRALNNTKGVTNSRVREKLNQSIQRSRISAPAEKKPKQIKQGSVEREDGEMGEGSGGEYAEGEGSPDLQAQQQQQQWVNTTNSESKLPQLPQPDKRPFDVDPKKNLKEQLKK